MGISCRINQFYQGLGSLLESRHGGQDTRAQARFELLGPPLTARQLRRRPLDLAVEIRVAALAQVVTVGALEPREIKPRRGTPHLRQIEILDHLLCREDLLIAVAPA